ncbi:MAG TPA: hypothetical protein VHK27_13120 [Gammaproteobacteria bacterium]|nr:hypothetical protein [Gammaproteobacteria bacterium]
MEPCRGKSICVPFESEDHYAICVVDPDRFRHYLMELHSRHPELLPAGFEQGFVFHDQTWSIKQRVLTRRLRLIATGQLYQVRPSFLMPSMSAWTEMVVRGMYLRHWSSLRCPGLPIEKLPEHLLAEEKPTWLEGHKRYLSTTMAGGCLRGASHRRIVGGPRISVIPRVRGFDWRWLMRKNWYPRSLTMVDTLLYLTQ